MEKNLAHRTNRDVECRSPLTTSSDFMLQWGKRKRLRCVKFQVKEHGTNNVSSGSKTVNPAAAGSDRRDARSGLICCTNNPNSQRFHNDRYGHNGGGSGPQNFRQQAASSSHKISRNPESWSGMKAHNSKRKGLVSSSRGTKKSCYSNNKNGGGGCRSGSSETANEGIEGGPPSSSGGDTILGVWPPKFVISLTNKEKEEDFFAIKGFKLPQRPKKRAKFVQRTLNLVSPGSWLCDLTLERYQVREKKITKKRAGGLKAMDSDSD